MKTRILNPLAVLALFISLLALSPASPARAATTWTVTKLADSNDGTCDSDCSLREAIAAADSGGGDSIDFAVTGTIMLALGQLSIGKDLTISGPGPAQLIIDGNDTSRIFNICCLYTVSLSGITLTNGYVAAGGGGALYYQSSDDTKSLTLDNMAVTGNSSGVSPDGYNVAGGILHSGGALYITNSLISDNTVLAGTGTTQAGGIFIAEATAYFSNVTISGNQAQGSIGLAGGLDVSSGATANFNNVTIANNTAGLSGAGIFVHNSAVAVNIRNSIVANNTAPNGPDCYTSSVALTSQDYNLIENTTDCNTAGATTNNITGQDPMLGPLAGNGGPTQTHALLTGSPALEAGDDANCAPTDQRGVVRPQGLHCDIGAYELAAPTDISLSANTVDENQPAGTTIGTLTTTDPDVGDTFTYSFCGGADDASFTLTGSALKTAAIFDYETNSGYSICIRSTDAGALHFDKTFAISINNLVDTQTFSDVPVPYWAWTYIERLYAAGITGGCGASPLIYCPEDFVTRAQMAVFLERGIHGSGFTPPVVPLTFNDTAGNFAQYWVEALKSEGITGGCGVGIYCPEASTTRAEMAVFLLRSEHGASYTPPLPTGTLFSDVSSGYWAAAWIEQLADEGITGGCGGGNYCPEDPVTRAQMAVFLVRTFNLP